MRFAAIALVLTACGWSRNPTTPKGGPRGLRASDHLQVAHQHDQLAEEAKRAPPPSEVYPGRIEPGFALAWSRQWNAVQEHERLAQIHRSAAADQYATFEQLCGARTAGEVAISPLVKYGIGGEATERGALVYLRPDFGTSDALFSELSCHRAFMMLAPADMDDCPLDLPGISIDAHGDKEGATLEITIDNPKLVPELQRRIAHELEAH